MNMKCHDGKNPKEENRPKYYDSNLQRHKCDEAKYQTLEKVRQLASRQNPSSPLYKCCGIWNGNNQSKASSVQSQGLKLTFVDSGPPGHQAWLSGGPA